MSGCVGAADATLPPEVTPYQLPTMTGDAPAIDDHVSPLVVAPGIDADVLFNKLLECYPTRSKWQIDVDLKAGSRIGEDASTVANGTDLGRNYAQIVASMPLYSATELDRKQKNEYDLRGDTAKRVATFVTAISSRNHAIRELALYQSLESRAAVRVHSGVTGADEQVTYLKEVASAQDSVIKAEADIMESRLALSSLCSKDNYTAINNHLKTLAAVPTGDK
ncbi:MAG: hypothetical protein BWK73_52685 [Thiothrix lacustris]|uniref:Uncharacterized protein n=1 Tax=Thiothrix lacustris TaxID=525917 RepID=A0A1Y1Q7L4_9GAMM|nr:MAG: hypothetical protein BWK73_52685 [Thiothrix lacustris]